MIDYLLERYTYDPDTGRIFHKKSGKEAGWIENNGYRRIGAKKVWAHRAAWALYYGEFPKGTIDHKNRNRLDNRITNLRDVPQKVQTLNRSGVKGAYYRSDRGVWFSKIIENKKYKWLGTFKTEEEAIAAYKAARAERDRRVDLSY